MDASLGKFLEVTVIKRRKHVKTLIVAYGFDGKVFRKRIVSWPVTKERIKRLQARWDQLYGGCMRYEMLTLN